MPQKHADVEGHNGCAYRPQLLPEKSFIYTILRIFSFLIATEYT